MNIETLIDKIKSFKTANGTKQSWRKDEPPKFIQRNVRISQMIYLKHMTCL